MKIVHVYAQNLKIFEDALDGTGCKVNGSCRLSTLQKSFPNFNVRDTLGLVVFSRVMTRKTLKLIQSFDELFVFNPLPIVVVCDDAVQLVEQGKIKTKHARLFALNSESGTISDVDLNRIFTTIACEADEIYYLDDVEKENAVNKPDKQEKIVEAKAVAEEVLAGLHALEEVT